MVGKFRPANAEAKSYSKSPEAARVELENLEKNDKAVLTYMLSENKPVGVLQILENVHSIRRVESACFTAETEAKLLNLVSRHKSKNLKDNAFAIQSSFERLINQNRIARVGRDAEGMKLYVVASKVEDRENQDKPIFGRSFRN